MTKQLLLQPHPEFKRVYGGGIIRWFDKTPHDIFCPHFWELNWAYGCRFECSYCYLQGTFHGNKKPWYRPLEQVIKTLDEFFEEQNKFQVLNSGELTDSFVYPHLIDQIADKFETQDKHKLLLLTKSGNVNFLVEKPRKQTIASFSISAPEVWNRWEKKTPSPEKRIDAARKVREAGYETRIRIDLIFPIENWQRCYDQLLNMLFSKLTPNRITLGTPRGLQKTLMFSKDLSWTEYFAEDSGWGKKLSSAVRKEIYLFFHDRLSDLGFNKIALCKETVSMWEELDREAGVFKSWEKKCNCAW